jgi:CBS domain-containing protein
MRIDELMTRSPRTITANVTIGEAWRLLRMLKVSHLPITNDDGGLVGLVSNADFAKAPIPRPVSELRGDQINSLMAPVSTVMTDARIVIEPDEDIEEALDLMTEHKMAVLPVIDPDGLVVGIVSSGDVVRGLTPRPGECCEKAGP